MAEKAPTPPSAFLRHPGAVLSDMIALAGGDNALQDTHGHVDLTAALARSVALHYGDPAGEQWALEAGKALVDRSDLSVVAVSGEDRHTWLTSLSTQDLTGLKAGESKELLILDAQGHIEHAAAVIDDGAVTYLVTEGISAGELAQWLNSMRFALRVSVEVRPDLTVIGSGGSVSRSTGLAPDAPDLLPQGSAGVELVWADPWPGVVEGGTDYFQGAHPGRFRKAYLHVVSVADVDAIVSSWLGEEGKRLAGLYAWEAVRVAAWRPRFGYETDARSIPAEVDWLRTAVHINKGCYRGQESVARVLNLGRPPRRLVALQLDGSRGDLPQVGAPIERSGRQVGVVTSVARHADEGPIALALVARNVPADEVFDLDGIAAAQELIVPVDGKASASPSQRPGAGLSNPLLRRPDMRGSATGGLAPV